MLPTTAAVLGRRSLALRAAAATAANVRLLATAAAPALPLPPAAALRGNNMDYYAKAVGGPLLPRVDAFREWAELRRKHDLWAWSRSTVGGPLPAIVARADNDAAPTMSGINLGSQDYLSLATHEAIQAAAIDAVKAYGVHSAGSPALMGNTAASLALERDLAALVRTEHVTLFPTGWSAGFGVIKALVRPTDHVVIDRLAHACLMEGVNASTRNVATHRHLDVAHARELLSRIRAQDATNGVLVVTEGIFSMDADVPNLVALQELCREFRATLLVDVAHDLGCMGDAGTGQLGIQGVLGSVDIVMGSFSKTFASNGGFVATASPGLRDYMRFFASPSSFSNAMSPVQARVGPRRSRSSARPRARSGGLPCWTTACTCGAA
jgi:7-keto-8-aminopelargonate synthetase-like enzyme